MWLSKAGTPLSRTEAFGIFTPCGAPKRETLAQTSEGHLKPSHHVSWQLKCLRMHFCVSSRAFGVGVMEVYEVIWVRFTGVEGQAQVPSTKSASWEVVDSINLII